MPKKNTIGSPKPTEGNKDTPIDDSRLIIGSADTKHPDYNNAKKSWDKIRDCIQGEDHIKGKGTTYLPQPSGMTGDYESAYEPYKERAHFPLICTYALSGALGIVITKLPEFNVPKQLEYILKTATKEGVSLQQLFLDIVIEIFSTGRVPLLVDIIAEKNEFRFVQYKAENFINWKSATIMDEKNLILGVLQESKPSNSNDIFSHEINDVYRVLRLTKEGKYETTLVEEGSDIGMETVSPSFMGKELDIIPLFLAGSISNSFDVQPIPLISVANCSIQIYRKEADLANSEYLSCNPTLCVTGATNDEDLPNVVGSSVMMVLPNEQARIFYTVTDTMALKQVSEHITSLYDEAIRHGVAILDARKGVEAAEALRIRQATQSASIYSIFLSAMNAITEGLKLMCIWGGYNEDGVTADAPTSLTQGLPDSAIIKAIIEGYTDGTVPLEVIHRYLVYSGLLDPQINYDEYLKLIKKGGIIPGTSTVISKKKSTSTEEE